MSVKNFVDTIVEKQISLNNQDLKSIVKNKIETGGSFIARGNGIASGIELIEKIFQRYDPKLKMFKVKEPHGSIRRGDSIISVRGDLKSILGIKDVCQDLLSELCGISTSVFKYTQEIKDLKCDILMLPNSLPYISEYINQSYIDGGAKIIGYSADYLYIQPIVYENSGGLEIFLENNFVEKEVYLEIANIEDFKKAIHCSCDNIVCNNLTKDDLQYILENKNSKRIGIRANIPLSEIRSYANQGIDFMIVDNLVGSIKNFDLDFRFFKN